MLPSRNWASVGEPRHFDEEQHESSQLFEFSDPLRKSPLRLRSRLPVESLPDRKRLAMVEQGRSKLTTPIQFDAAQGEIAEDILWTQLVRPVCVSGRLIRLLNENEISGWTVYPVEIYDQNGVNIPDYYGFAITGPVYEADYSRSTIVLKPSPLPRGKSSKVYKGLYFDEGQWISTSSSYGNVSEKAVRPSLAG